MKKKAFRKGVGQVKELLKHSYLPTFIKTGELNWKLMGAYVNGKVLIALLWHASMHPLYIRTRSSIIFIIFFLQNWRQKKKKGRIWDRG